MKQEYDRDGFVVVRDFLPASELAELQQNIERYIADVVPSISDGDAFYSDKSRPETLRQLHRMDQDDYFQNIMSDVKWNQLATALNGEPSTAGPPEWFNKPPGMNHVTPPHQDNYYFCLEPCHVVTIWLALDEIDTENGCLRYVRGSHPRGVRKHTASNILGFSQGISDYSVDDFLQEVAVPLKPGDVVAHHGWTIHRADANISANRHRRAFAMVFKGATCKRNEELFAAYQSLVEQQQRSIRAS